MLGATRDLLEAAQDGRRPDAVVALALAAEDDLAPLLACAQPRSATGRTPMS